MARLSSWSITVVPQSSPSSRAPGAAAAMKGRWLGGESDRRIADVLCLMPAVLAARRVCEGV